MHSGELWGHFYIGDWFRTPCPWTGTCRCIHIVKPNTTSASCFLDQLFPKPNHHKASTSNSTAAKVAQRKSVGQKTVYLVPKADVQNLTEAVKATCEFAGLKESPELWSDMSSAEVKDTLKAQFAQITDFTEHSFE